MQDDDWDLYHAVIDPARQAEVEAFFKTLRTRKQVEDIAPAIGDVLDDAWIMYNDDESIDRKEFQRIVRLVHPWVSTHTWTYLCYYKRAYERAVRSLELALTLAEFHVVQKGMLKSPVFRSSDSDDE